MSDKDVLRLRYRIASDQATAATRAHWESVLARPVTGMASLTLAERRVAVVRRAAWGVA